jgi:hypothetical protein
MEDPSRQKYRTTATTPKKSWGMECRSEWIINSNKISWTELSCNSSILWIGNIKNKYVVPNQNWAKCH